LVHYELGIRLSHNCPFNTLSRKYGSMVLAWWNNFDQDVLEASGGMADSFQGYREDLQKAISFMGGRILRQTGTDSKLQFVVRWDGTRWEYSTSSVFLKHRSLVLQPTIHSDGWEWYRVVCFSEKDVRKLFEDLDSAYSVEVTSKKTVESGTVRDNFVITVSDLLGDLTGYQARALAVALDSGYYAVPKKATTEAVATRVGLARTTYEEHLRKAESKVMQSLAPYVQSLARRPSARKPGRDVLHRTNARIEVKLPDAV
jgi:predicted DNA binding protein